jgi:AcrR family transcriptional regulator
MAARPRNAVRSAGVRSAGLVRPARVTRSAPDHRGANKGRATIVKKTDIDRETRERLLDAAVHLFAEHGFHKVTVRDICRDAGANVAAINYHFGGKSGLYEQVLRKAMAIMQATTEEIREAGEHQRPEVQLEAAITIFLTRVITTPNRWIQQLMLQEVSSPTPAFDMVLDDVLKPRIAYVRNAIAGIIGCRGDDSRVAMCVMSVQAQLFALLNNPLAGRLEGPKLTPDRAKAIARHIACFSIAGVRAIAAT